MKKFFLVLVMHLFIVSDIFADVSFEKHNEMNMTHNSQHHKTSDQVDDLKTYVPSVRLSIKKIENQGNKKLVYINLITIKDNKPLTLDKLKEVHTQKIHILIIDENLQDYSHVHPRETKDPGVYTVEWMPKSKGHYRIWAELVPLNTDVQEYAVTDLVLIEKNKSEVNRTVSMQSTMQGLLFNLSFDNKVLQSGKIYMGKIDITDSQGLPFKELEPIMGSFAHIVGFSDDLKTVVHIHPMGTEPTKPTDRGGPELKFHIEPKKFGFIKIFVQIRLKGEEIFVPFGIEIQNEN